LNFSRAIDVIFERFRNCSVTLICERTIQKCSRVVDIILEYLGKCSRVIKYILVFIGIVLAICIIGIVPLDFIREFRWDARRPGGPPPPRLTAWASKPSVASPSSYRKRAHSSLPIIP
jgi:hypothetical protein